MFNLCSVMVQGCIASEDLVVHRGNPHTAARAERALLPRSHRSCPAVRAHDPGSVAKGTAYRAKSDSLQYSVATVVMTQRDRLVVRHKKRRSVRIADLVRNLKLKPPGARSAAFVGGQGGCLVDPVRARDRKRAHGHSALRRIAPRGLVREQEYIYLRGRPIGEVDSDYITGRDLQASRIDIDISGLK